LFVLILEKKGGLTVPENRKQGTNAIASKGW